MKNLARDGRTVIASVHQPCSEVFDLFDNLFLLSHGQTIFFREAAIANEVLPLALLSSISKPNKTLNPSVHGSTNLYCTQLSLVLCSGVSCFLFFVCVRIQEWQLCSPHDPQIQALISIILCSFIYLQHFSASGFPCLPLRNPADHFLRAVNADFDRVKATLKGPFKIRVCAPHLLFPLLPLKCHQNPGNH